MIHTLGYRAVAIPLVLATLTVAGCNKGDNKGDAKVDAKKAATQVAAKVNSAEITVSQINAVLARNPNMSPETVERAKRDILEKLIEAEVAKAAAIDKKLDRTPKVVQALETSKTEILARSYVEQIATSLPPVTAEFVVRFTASGLWKRIIVRCGRARPAGEASSLALPSPRGGPGAARP